MSLLTDVQYLKIEPYEKRTHTNESMILINAFSVQICQMNIVHFMSYRKKLLVYNPFDFSVE